MKHALLALSMFAASAVVAPAAQADEGLKWMSGCWQTKDKSYREVWTKPDSGFLFGYSLTFEDGAVAFFEQSRIDEGAPAGFNAHPGGVGPSEIPRPTRAKKTPTL